MISYQDPAELIVVDDGNGSHSWMCTRKLLLEAIKRDGWTYIGFDRWRQPDHDAYNILCRVVPVIWDIDYDDDTPRFSWNAADDAWQLD